MSDTGGIADEIVPIASEAHKYLKKIGAYDKVKNWLLRKNSYPVLVLGASGAGKSSFIKSISGEVAFIRRIDRSDSVTTKTTELAGSFIEIIDTPGEVQHRDKRLEAFKKALRFSSFGIINVVSFGYHEGLAATDRAIDNGRAREEFLGERRKVEIDLMKEWNNLLCGKGATASWIITVVTKADLWWLPSADQRVLQYYQSDEYREALGEGTNLPHSVRPYSSINSLFYGQSPMTGYYSDRKRSEDHGALLGHLLQKASEHG